MKRKAIIIADPGIDTAFALVLALSDPTLDVLAVVASAGNVSAEQATSNVHIVVGQVDPPRWPRIGAALPVSYGIDGSKLHGPGGLGGWNAPDVQLHQPTPGDKLIVDVLREHPGEVNVVVLGPATMLARALDRDVDTHKLLRKVICVGGTRHEPGNAGPVSEFHFACDPLASREVLRCKAPITLLPLDVTRRLLFSPTDLLDMLSVDSPVCRFLRQIVPYGIGATSNLYGIESFHLKDVMGIVALSLPALLSTQAVVADVETRGELTRGMSVFDLRPLCPTRPNVDLVVGVDVKSAREYITRMLSRDLEG